MRIFTRRIKEHAVFGVFLLEVQHAVINTLADKLLLILLKNTHNNASTFKISVSLCKFAFDCLLLADNT